ncbi:replication protein A 70 kDa DNA-binding subunit B-like isoform X2 [Triticum urartu]|uniref:replication protein A 70 kDa DNA-binding subunit B-like isoform X2 n=1 Tax=Triticum urartu TaxID=4572 RepID=UPI002043116F|nr:replication protein A 70 kDa DNA-binding subunit B-like isoform X2 [Triticum urartu]
MYAQLPPEASEHLKDVLEEGKVSLMKFMCNQLESSFRTVESPYMIQFTRYSTAVPQPGLEDAYPYCTYNLLPFPGIPRPTSNTPRFLDVIGQITALSDIIPVQSMYQPQPSDTRTIILTDLMGNEIKILLWGARAHEFAAEDVRAASIESAVVAIFVGTLPKMSQGVKLLSGSSACRWYINEDLPEINAFHSSLGKEVAPVAVYAPIDQGIGASICEPPVEMTFKQLLALDPLDNLGKPFICKVTITRLGSDQRWWFLSCVACHKTAYVNGPRFRCSDQGCSSVGGEPAYSICTFATDGSAEAEFNVLRESWQNSNRQTTSNLAAAKVSRVFTIQRFATLRR